MPFVENGDFRLHYELAGPANAPAVVFSNSLGTDLSMWDSQAAALGKNFRVLRYDTRGHGQSSITPGPYTIEQLARDVLRLLDALALERVNFCGLSMGGMTGMWLAANAPQRVNKLALCSTGARIGAADTWSKRIEAVCNGGMKAVAQAVIERFLSPEFRARSPQVATRMQRTLEQLSPRGYVACCAAIRDGDLRPALPAIHAPTLVIMGSKDAATPPADGRLLRDHIAGSQYVELDAAHLANIEQPEEFNAELARFLAA